MIQRQMHAGLERPGGADARQTDPQLHQRLRHLRLDAGQDHLRPQQPHRLRSAHQRIGDLRIDHLHPGDVDNRHVRVMGGDPFEQGVDDLLRPRAVDGADQRHNHGCVADRNERGGEFADGGALRVDHLLLKREAFLLGALLVADVA